MHNDIKVYKSAKQIILMAWNGCTYRVIRKTFKVDLLLIYLKNTGNGKGDNGCRGVICSSNTNVCYICRHGE